MTRKQKDDCLEIRGYHWDAMSGPLFSAYTILAKPYSQTKAWSVCRFVLLSEKPSSQHALGMEELVLGPHFAVPCFNESNAGSLGEANS